MGKLSIGDRRERLFEKLEEQRHLLRKAVEALASGDLAEALHISTILRVLVHETGRQKPLLKQLKPNFLDLPIPDETRPAEEKEKLPPGVQKAVVLSVPIHFKISPEGVFLNPELSGLQASSTLGKWWERPSLIIPGSSGFSRKEVVLGLADKEGGTHVDPEVPERYQALLNYKAFRLGFGETKADVPAVNLSRLMVGQAGVEMLDCLARNFPEPVVLAENATEGPA